MAFVFAAGVAIWGQTPAPPQTPPTPQTGKNAPELSSQEVAVPPTFSTRVNLVMVPVVVRDKNGKAIGTLQKSDFQLLDKGKPQVIAKFSLEKGVKPPATITAEDGAPIPSADSGPDRFVVYMFDDLHISVGDLMQIRIAADRQIADVLAPNTRVAIYTTSGTGNQEFTSDLPLLRQAIARLRPRSQTALAQCPDLGYYQANLIVENEDQSALDAAIQDAAACAHLDLTQPGMVQLATQLAKAAANQIKVTVEQDTRVALISLRDTVRRMAAMPGQRMLVFISPGFLIPTSSRDEETDVFDRAVRANVMISTLDARGLWAMSPGGDASQVQNGSIMTQTARDLYGRTTMQLQADTLAELSWATGGSWIHNTNDLEGGFKRVSAPPEFYYILGFSPQNLKFDGSMHPLKIKVANSKGLDIQARHAYFAPRHQTDPVQQAKEEMREAMFSRDELVELPIQLHTQFFKSGDIQATLAVLARIDLKGVRFQKVDGRNCDTLTIISGLFDNNGNYVKGLEKRIEMKLKDETLQARLNSGITLRSDFDVPPGKYVVRLVVRDSAGQTMAARNAAVEIPY